MIVAYDIAGGKRHVVPDGWLSGTSIPWIVTRHCYIPRGLDRIYVKSDEECQYGRAHEGWYLRHVCPKAPWYEDGVEISKIVHSYFLNSGKISAARTVPCCNALLDYYAITPDYPLRGAIEELDNAKIWAYIDPLDRTTMYYIDGEKTDYETFVLTWHYTLIEQ